jgi:plasmid maintenance system antidote protein VapI
MSTSNSETLKAKFKDLFNLSENEKIEHDAQMLSFIVLSEFEKILVEKGWSRKDLADKIGTSPSYITQLFRGDRLLNFKMIAKMQKALNAEINISVSLHHLSKNENRNGKSVNYKLKNANSFITTP